MLWNIGGHNTPANPWPDAIIATAKPRLLSNQRVAFATKGAIIAAFPKRPIRTPLASHKPQRSCVKLATKAPRAIMREPNTAGPRMPRRSIHNPIKIPPIPAPIIISE